MHKTRSFLSYCQLLASGWDYFLIHLIEKRYPAGSLPDIYINSKYF